MSDDVYPPTDSPGATSLSDGLYSPLEYGGSEPIPNLHDDDDLKDFILKNKLFDFDEAEPSDPNAADTSADDFTEVDQAEFSDSNTVVDTNAVDTNTVQPNTADSAAYDMNSVQPTAADTSGDDFSEVDQAVFSDSNTVVDTNTADSTANSNRSKFFNLDDVEYSTLLEGGYVEGVNLKRLGPPTEDGRLTYISDGKNGKNFLVIPRKKDLTQDFFKAEMLLWGQGAPKMLRKKRFTTDHLRQRYLIDLKTVNTTIDAAWDEVFTDLRVQKSEQGWMGVIDAVGQRNHKERLVAAEERKRKDEHSHVERKEERKYHHKERMQTSAQQHDERMGYLDLLQQMATPGRTPMRSAVASFNKKARPKCVSSKSAARIDYSFDSDDDSDDTQPTPEKPKARGKKSTDYSDDETADTPRSLKKPKARGKKSTDDEIYESCSFDSDNDTAETQPSPKKPKARGKKKKSTVDFKTPSKPSTRGGKTAKTLRKINKTKATQVEPAAGKLRSGRKFAADA